MRSLTRTTAAAVLASCAVAPAAAAIGPTPPHPAPAFPAANKLCAAVAKGAGPAKLRPEAAKLLADCATLQTSYAADEAAFVAARTPLFAQLRAVVTAKACAGLPSPSAACSQAQALKHAQRAALELQRSALLHKHHIEMEALRSAFWTAERALEKEGATALHAAHVRS